MAYTKDNISGYHQYTFPVILEGFERVLYCQDNMEYNILNSIFNRLLLYETEILP